MNFQPWDSAPDTTAAATDASLAPASMPHGGNASKTGDPALRTESASTPGHSVTPGVPTVGTESDAAAPRGVLTRGLSARLATDVLQRRAWCIALSVAHRFRVIRTIDVAVACYPERPFKTALGAAQRAVRGMVKAGLLKRYKTARFQTVYGLTQSGVAWLSEHGIEGRASVRRVSDMTNPEHRLPANEVPRPSAAREVLRRQQRLGLRQQLGAAHAQRLCDLQHGRKRRHVLATLDLAGVRSLDLGQVRQRFLSDAAPRSGSTNGATKGSCQNRISRLRTQRSATPNRSFLHGQEAPV